jgi:hypothetical protein
MSIDMAQLAIVLSSILALIGALGGVVAVKGKGKIEDAMVELGGAASDLSMLVSDTVAAVKDNTITVEELQKMEADGLEIKKHIDTIIAEFRS